MKSFEIFLETVSEANCSQHWTVKAKRHKQQQFFIRLAYNKYIKSINLPCKVIFTRLSPKFLDDDNLPTSLKYIRDEISECIFPEKRKTCITKKGKVKSIKGHADSDPRVKWLYKQEKSEQKKIRVEIEDD